MLICDTHCDTLYSLAMHPGRPTDVTFETLRAGGVSVQTLAMFVGDSPRLEDIRACFGRMLAAFDRLKARGAKQILSPAEGAEGECRFMLSVEGCDLLADGLGVLDDWARIGVRMAALTWNYKNAVGTPHCGDRAEPLTPLGREAVRKMRRLGIAVDVSHLNEGGFFDLLEMGCVPLASHSCAKALCGHSRNLSDEQLKKLFECGGYVGVNFYPGFLREDGKATCLDVAEHLEHMLGLGGEGRIGLGSDFDGIETKPEGLEDPSGLPRLMDLLERRFGGAVTRGIAGENLVSYFARVSGRTAGAGGRKEGTA